MPATDFRTRLDRGRRAEDCLRQPILQDAADELNRRAFNDFINAAEASDGGEALRARALRAVLGAETLFNILREWAAEAYALTERMNEDEASDV